MFRLLKELILAVVINAGILYGLNYYHFALEINVQTGGLKTFLILGFILWIVNFVLRKILHMLALPLRVLTFGLISFVINVWVIYFFTWFVNTYYHDLATITLSESYFKVLILSFVITFVYSFLYKLLK